MLTDHGGDWDAYLEAVYAAFVSDFVTNPPPPFDGKRVGLKRHPRFKDKEATFWHFVSEGRAEEERLPDLRRCERIRWPRAMIDAVNSGRVAGWKNKREGEERYVLALPDFSYVVVLADRGGYVLPWTAYSVEYEHRRRRLRMEHEAARKSWCRP